MDSGAVISALVAVIGVLWSALCALALKLYNSVVQENKELKQTIKDDRAAGTKLAERTATMIETFYDAWRRTTPGLDGAPRHRE